jgi:UDP-N-acetylmuramate--alanine ligase
MTPPIPQRVHLVGVGGMHMSAIARILLAWGHQVSGSDLRRSPLTDAISDLGARVVIGPHDAANIGDPDLVVTTSAATADNPELNEARRRDIPVIKRADMVARLMEGKIGVCVAGCHGKSTTSGLLAFVLEEAKLEPTYLIGAEVAALGKNAAPGAGPHVVVEADEYDRAFLSYHPQVALVTNVEADHLDYYGTWEAVQEAFRQFASQVGTANLLPPVETGGVVSPTLVLCADNAEALALQASAHPGVNVVTYALEADADWRVWMLDERAGRQTFTAAYRGDSFGRFAVTLPGRHNVENALGAIAVAHALGLDPETIADAMERYTGVRRRFERVGMAGDIIVMDDYAHHPTEIEALAAAARSRFPDNRIVVLFQPHTYARTRYLLDGFKTCFRNFDRLFILETYTAREAIADGMTGAQLAAELDPPPGYCETFEAAAKAIAAELKPGDVFFTVGAGDVDCVGPMVLEKLVVGDTKRE